MSSNCIGDAAMDSRKRLEGLSRPVLVEVVYLAGRYLTHGLTQDVFLRQLESDVKTKHREQSVGVVLDVIAAIESAEGAPIRDLPMGKRFALAAELDDVLWSASRGKLTTLRSKMRSQHSGHTGNSSSHFQGSAGLRACARPKW